jgi:tetratricopeptide (TPR) repeat protein
MLRICCLLLVVGLQFGCQNDPESKARAAISRAKRELADRNYSRALMQLRIALRQSPANAEAFYQAGLVHLAMLEVPSAYVNLKKAVDLDANHVEARNRLAELFSSSTNESHLMEAAEFAQQAIALDPADSSAINSLAIANFKLGDPQAAEAALRRLMDSPQVDARSVVNAALMRLHSKDAAGALSILEGGSRRLPQSNDLSLVLARLYATQNNLPAAIAELTRANQLKSATALSWATLASLHAAANQQPQALEAYRKASSFGDPNYSHYLALYHWNTGNRPEAVKLLQKLYQDQPRDYLSRRRYVNALRQTGQQSQADQLLLDAHGKNPKDTDAVISYCNSLVASGRVEAAVNKLRQLIADDASNHHAHFFLARIHLARRQLPLHRDELAQALKINPGFLPARLELAKALNSNGRPQNALELLDQATLEQKSTVVWLECRNWALLTKGDLSLAKAGIDRVLTLGQSTEALLQRSFYHLASKQFDAARQDLRTVLELDPSSVRAFDALGNSYLAQRQTPEALKSLKAFAAVHKNIIPIQFAYSLWLSQHASVRDAEAVLKDAQKIAPDDLSITVRLGELAFASKRFPEARQYLSSALSRNPRLARGQLLLAHIESIEGKRDLAMAGYRFVIDLDPENVEALNNLAAMLSDNPLSVDEGLKFAQKAKELSPADPNISDTFGWLLYQKGLFRESVPVLESALSNSNPVTRYHLAMAYARNGEAQRAKVFLAQALKLAPDLPEAKQANQLIQNISTQSSSPNPSR